MPCADTCSRVVTPHPPPGQEEATALSLPSSGVFVVLLVLAHGHKRAWPSPFFPAACASLADVTGGSTGWPREMEAKQGLRNARELRGIMGNVIYSLNAENLPCLPPRQQTNPCPVMTKSLPFYYFSIGFRCSVSAPYSPS